MPRHHKTSKEKIKKCGIDSLVAFSYKALDSYWIDILEKCKLSPKKISPPFIELTRTGSKFMDSDIIDISLGTAKKAYKEYKNEYSSYIYIPVLKDDIIHESVHYIQNLFYDVTKKSYDPFSEGVAVCLTDELLLEETKNRHHVLGHLASALYLTGASLDDIVHEEFSISKKECEYVNSLIANGQIKAHYKSKKSEYIEHAEGFVKVAQLRKKYGFNILIKEPNKFAHLF